MIHRKSLALGLVVACLGLAACGMSTAYMPLNTPPHPISAKDPSSVEIFTTSKPAQAYVEVGLIQSSIDGALSTSGTFELMQALRTEGGKHGCDAVLVTTEDKMASGNGTVVAERTSGVRATCIVYSD